MDSFFPGSPGQGRRRHYFDWAATAIPAPPDPQSLKTFGNPSSLHYEGRYAREALEDARTRCAAVLGLDPRQLYFTSGGTESNALVLHSLLLRKPSPGILVSAVEHPSVRENCLVLERLGKQIVLIGVEQDGRVSPGRLEKAWEKVEKGANPESPGKRTEPRFAAIMGVNNETGSVMDLPGLVRRIRARGGAPVHVHSDLVQALGKVPVDIAAWDLDSASISAHKLGGPRGMGLLYLRKPLEPLYTGGGQERGIRPGTESVAGALALASCLESRAAPPQLAGEYEKAARRFTRLISGLQTLPGCFLIPQDRGEADPRFSPYILQAGFKGIPGEVMVRALDERGYAVSTGSACSAAYRDRPVLAAMGLDKQACLEGIRISQGWSTTGEDIEGLLETLREVLALFPGIPGKEG
ncbi:MAG: cysteine desulfurase [Treponema sp.]|jgi:cysteine desulfurase|nr:cysteine desulfurase [Treponema sp.]